MFDSRSLDELNIDVHMKASAFIKNCNANGVSILVTSTFRDFESQEALYQIGRSLPGHIVTNARGGESYHQYRLAFDCYPIIGGKPLWNVFDTNDKMLSEWLVLEEAAKATDLEWAGNWKAFREYAHFQDSAGMTVQELKAKYPNGVTKS